MKIPLPLKEKQQKHEMIMEVVVVGKQIDRVVSDKLAEGRPRSGLSPLTPYDRKR